ncbi:hypothetical protein [Paraburkholderia unamae]|uniref:Uncharacterized protein n=1 Tax=Paraburkholderia unamae TaxID=219649 RepID=A0ACC6RIF4_9BURK
MEQASRGQPDFASRSKNRLQDVICVTRIPVFRAFDEGAGETGSPGESLVATGSAGDWKLSGRLNEVKKPVDRSPGSLHNLVSLLLTQQRRKRRVVRWFNGAFAIDL